MIGITKQEELQSSMEHCASETFSSFAAAPQAMCDMMPAARGFGFGGPQMQMECESESMATFGGGGGFGGGGERMAKSASVAPMMRRSMARGGKGGKGGGAPPPPPAAPRRIETWGDDDAGQAATPSGTSKFESKEAPAHGVKEVQDKALALEEDLTQFPHLMDARFESLDEDSALRPTIINVQTNWKKKTQAGLLSKPITVTMDEEQIKGSKEEAFELLDALTRAGALTVNAAELHVIVAATHTFDKSLMDTVIQDNVNPISKVERSSLIMAGTVHSKPVAEMVSENSLQRIHDTCPMLFLTEGTKETEAMEEEEEEEPNYNGQQ